MKIYVQQKVELDIKYLTIFAKVRYWEDAEINGIADVEGNIPLRIGDAWSVSVNIETGEVVSWPKGTSASIHYKVCDQGNYYLMDSKFVRVLEYGDHYVPDCLGIKESSYGDYIIFDINSDGFIENWDKERIGKEVNAGKWRINTFHTPQKQDAEIQRLREIAVTMKSALKASSKVLSCEVMSKSGLIDALEQSKHALELAQNLE